MSNSPVTVDHVGGRSTPLPGESGNFVRLNEVYVPNTAVGFFRDPNTKIEQAAYLGTVRALREAGIPVPKQTGRFAGLVERWRGNGSAAQQPAAEDTRSSSCVR